MRVINVAQGALVILSAYLSYVLFSALRRRPVPLDRAARAPAMFALGVAVQLVFIRSLRSEQAEELSLLSRGRSRSGSRGCSASATRRRTGRRTRAMRTRRGRSLGYQVSVVRASTPSPPRSASSSLLYAAAPRRASAARSARPCRTRARRRLLGVDADRVGARVRRRDARPRRPGAVYGVALSVQSGQPLRPDLAAALDHRPRRARQRRRGSRRGALLGVTESVVAVEYSPTWASFSFFAS